MISMDLSGKIAIVTGAADAGTAGALRHAPLNGPGVAFGHGAIIGHAFLPLPEPFIGGDEGCAGAGGETASLEPCTSILTA